MSSGSLKIIRNFDDPFAHIENAILRDKRMSLAERGFFALILSLPTNREMTLVYFSKVSGANKETVGRYFHKLEDLGYLRRYRERGEHGVFGPTVYEFTTSGISPCTDFPCTAEPCTAEPATAEPCTEDPAQKNKRKKNTIPPIIPQRENEPAADRFEGFWRWYRTEYCADDRSRAGDKARARKAWNQLKPSEAQADKMGAYLLRQMRTELHQRGYGIPYTSTFLNAVRKGEIDLTPQVDDDPPPARAPDAPRQEAWGWQT